MPEFEHLPYPSRYNSLRLLNYNYASSKKLCAITLVADSRRPVFADMLLAKSILASLLSPETLANLHLQAFTLMPDHLHLVGGVRSPDLNLPAIIGSFKSFTTQLYWRRCREITKSGEVSLPSERVSKCDSQEARRLLAPWIDGRATLRPEVIELKNWPDVRPEMFLKKHLWQSKFFDHIIRNDQDLQENLEYIAMNSVRAGYVSRSCFYPYTGFMG